MDGSLKKDQIYSSIYKQKIIAVKHPIYIYSIFPVLHLQIRIHSPVLEDVYAKEYF